MTTNIREINLIRNQKKCEYKQWNTIILQLIGEV